MTSQSSSSNVTPTTDSSSSSSRSNVTPTTESSRTAPQQQPPSPGQEGQAASVPQPMVRELLAKASGYYGCDLDTFITILSGSVSGVAATFAKQPIQRVKWIRQVHEGHAKPYTSIVKDTLTRGGPRGFFAGSMAAIYRNVPHSTLAYTVYPKAETFVFALQTGRGEAWLDATLRGRKGGAAGQRQEPPFDDKPGQSFSKSRRSFSTRFWAGYITLFGTTMVTHPLDTLRVRLSVHSDAAADGFVRSFAKLWRAEGVTGFYRGFSATLLGAGPRGALGFGIFETLKDGLNRSTTTTASEPSNNPVGGWLRSNPAAGKFLCGYAAGLLSEFFIYPLDTIRRRQQALGSASSISGSGVVGSLRLILRTEGVRGMFRGIALNLFKNPVATAVSFAVNDFVKEAVGYGQHSHSHSVR